MDSFNWLHLTDLHWGQTGLRDKWPRIRAQFFKDLRTLHAKTGPWHAVLFTGDLVHKGAANEFQELENEVLGPLWDKFAQLECDPVLLAVPGNHDLQRPTGRKHEGAADLLKTPGQFQGKSQKFWNDERGEYRRVVDQAFANYTKWWKTRPHAKTQKIADGKLPGDFSTTFETEGGRKIGILGLNIAFLQLGDEIEAGHLACDEAQFHTACQPDGEQWRNRHDVCLMMTHQPPDWLDKPSREKAYADINPAGTFAVHLFGHMHEEVLRGFSRGGGQTVRWWQGCSLFGLENYRHATKEDRRHGYSAGTLQFDKDHALLRHWPRRAYHDGTNGWRFAPDAEGCVLEEDHGTSPVTISLRGEPAEPLDQITARALGNYHAQVQGEWAARWSGVIDDKPSE